MAHQFHLENRQYEILSGMQILFPFPTFFPPYPTLKMFEGKCLA